MNIGGAEIAHEPGQTYEKTHGLPGSEAAGARADARQKAIEEFKGKAQQSTELQLRQAMTGVLGLVIQLRALGATGDRDLANQLREAADFLEDL